MKIGPGVSELWGVENRPLPLTRPMAYTTACTTVQAVICVCSNVELRTDVYKGFAVLGMKTNKRIALSQTKPRIDKVEREKHAQLSH